MIGWKEEIFNYLGILIYVQSQEKIKQVLFNEKSLFNFRMSHFST